MNIDELVEELREEYGLGCDDFAQPWRTKAACKDEPSALFYPQPGQRLAALKAKAICATCPVTEECLDHALSHSGAEGRYGVWGGYTETERRQIGRTRKRAAS